MTLDELRKITNKTIQSAGPRYTPGVDGRAPNLHIRDLEIAIAGLSVNSQFSTLLDERANSLLESLKQAGNSLSGQHEIADRLSSAASSLQQLARQSPQRGKALLGRLQDVIAKLERLVLDASESISNAIREKHDELSRTGGNRANSETAPSRHGNSELEKLHQVNDDLCRIEIQCRSCKQLLDSTALRLRFANRALLLGPWGSGKTHFLCDVSLTLLNAKIPSAVLLAKDISASGDIAANLCSVFGLPSLDGILCKLDEMGRTVNARAILIIDGVNEGDFDSWRRFIYHLTSRVKHYKNFGLVLSCRTPMEKLLFSAQTRKQYVDIHHPGFGEVEFDAQRAFFSFYGIPLPEVPLLTEEFSRPLTLKILCESFAILPKKEQRKGFIGLTSGQKGMTFVLESFVKRRTAQLERDLMLPSLFCWKLIKGDDAIKDHCLSGLAPYMAEKMIDAVPFKEATRIARARPETSSTAKAKLLLTRLIQEGVIHDYARWTGQGDSYERVIALPYQRFSDHIIARHLLARHLDKTDESTIRASLVPGTPLGRAFELEDEWSYEYANPALAEAIIIEFPEAVKKKVKEGSRELYFFLPKEAKDLNFYCRPFIDGFSWRSPVTIDASTKRIIAALVNPKYQEVYRLTMDVLVMVATKPEHPLSAERLFRYLGGLSMPERDLSWSEALRNTQPGSSIDRVIHFYSKVPLKSLTSEIANLAVMLLASFLTTTDRVLRDKATLGLVRVGELQPASLFSFAEAALTFNDPYVGERVLAAMYGTTMSLWCIASNDFKIALADLASFLVKEMFAPNGRFRTCHVLTRDYALGIVELSKLVVPGTFPTILEQYLAPSFPAIMSPFPESRRISSSSVKKVSSAIHIDFGNYTLGRLIKGRSNYDFDNPTYKIVRRQIEWRMAQLGYSCKKFEGVDAAIARSQSHGRGDNAKVNRYGKKYSWIAYFEMYGLRQAQGLIDQYERPGDCDIDPSFPLEERISMPPMAAFFSRKRLPKQHIRWLKSGPAPDYRALLRRTEINGESGPWRLICGFVDEADQESLHQLWAQIRTFLVPEEHIEDFRTEYMKDGFPPHELSNVSEDYYTYAGEISWSKRFGSRYGVDRESAYTVTAYTRHEQQPVRESFKEGWQHLDPGLILKYLKSRSETAKKRNRAALVRHLKQVNKQLSADDQLTIQEITDLRQYPSQDDFLKGQMHSMRWVTVGGFEVEPLAWSFSWESYHSEVNQVRFYLPNPCFCEDFGLNPRMRSIGLFEPSGARATYYIKERNSYSDGAKLLYIREDLLRRYAENRGKHIVTLSWGERQVHHTIADGFWRDDSRPDDLNVDDAIFKYFQVD